MLESGCQAGSTGIGLLGASFLIDGVLTSSGNEKIFEPIISKNINLLIGNKKAKDIYTELVERSHQLKNESDKYNLLTKNINENKKSIDKLVNDKFIESNEGEEFKKRLDEVLTSNYSEFKNKAVKLTEDYKTELKKKDLKRVKNKILFFIF